MAEEKVGENEDNIPDQWLPLNLKELREPSSKTSATTRRPVPAGSRLKSRSGRPAAKPKIRRIPPTPAPHLPKLPLLWLPDGCFLSEADRSDILPWPVEQLKKPSFTDVSSAQLAHSLSRPPLWIFPQSRKLLPSDTWCPDLMKSGDVDKLMETEPWEILATEMPDMGLPSSPRFTEFRARFQ